jgi:pimeloyl-ACP methyl ester carboxylesterase
LSEVPAARLWSTGSVPGLPRLVYGRTGVGPDPVVALHGITAQHRAFTPLARWLARPDGMLAPDLRGRGDSAKPPLGYGLKAHARDVVRLLDHARIARAVLVGHSMGAFVAVATALAFPERVRALALLDGGWPRADAGGPEPDPEPLRAGLDKAFKRLTMTFPDPEAYLDYWFPGAGLRMGALPPDLADYYRYDLEPVAGGWRPKASIVAARFDAEYNSRRAPDAAAMRAIRCPVLLVRAGQGFAPGSPPLFTPTVRTATMAAVGVTEELVLDEATHYSMLIEPAMAARVAAAVDRLATASGPMLEPPRQPPR